MLQPDDQEDYTRQWPSIADMFLALLLMFLLLLFMSFLSRYSATNDITEHPAVDVAAPEGNISGMQYDELLARFRKAGREAAGLKARLDLMQDKPPIITLDEKSTPYRFRLGEGTVSQKFRESLYALAFRQMTDLLRKYKDEVDTIEIIGHTDGISVQHRGNLDERLPDVVRGRLPAADLIAGSNADLGLIRALAIKQEWESWVAAKIADTKENSFLARFKLRCYSAAESIPPEASSNATLSDPHGQNPAARRIEIRFAELRARPEMASTTPTSPAPLMESR